MCTYHSYSLIINPIHELILLTLDGRSVKYRAKILNIFCNALLFLSPNPPKVFQRKFICRGTPTRFKIADGDVMLF